MMFEGRLRSRSELIFASARQLDFFAAEGDCSKCLHATSSNVLFCTHYISNVDYYKFSHVNVL